MTLRYLVRLVACLLVAGGWLAPPSAHAQSLDELADLFVRIAGRPEYSRTATSGIHKWQKTVRYAVIGETREAMGPRIDRHMALMRALTGRPIERVDPDGGLGAAARVIAAGLGRFNVSAPATADDDIARQPAVSFRNAGGQIVWRGNFFIFVGRRGEMAALTQGFRAESPNLAQRIASGSASCTSVLHFTEQPPSIATVFIFLPTDMEAWRVDRCVEEEVTQSFGLMNDVRGSKLTLFDDDLRQGKRQLTEIDKVFLRTLYDPRIQPGMSGGALKAAAREVIRGLRGR